MLGDQQITVNFNEGDQSLTVPENISSLLPSDPLDDGSTQYEYTSRTTITVTPKVGSPVTDFVDTTIIQKNPCINPDMV